LRFESTEYTKQKENSLPFITDLDLFLRSLLPDIHSVVGHIGLVFRTIVSEAFSDETLNENIIKTDPGLFRLLNLTLPLQ